MAKFQAHRVQWEHNRSLLAHIPSSHADWQVTIIFYAALQVIDTLLAYDNISATSHDSRNATLKQTNRYDKSWRHYAPLYDLSRKVRYLADPAIWIKAEDIDVQVLRRILYPIERSVATLTPNITWPAFAPIALRQVQATATPGEH